MIVSGWGRYPRQYCAVNRPRTEAELRSVMATGSFIARGNGRAYGDCAMNRGNTIDMRGFNRMLGFDAESGILVAESGVLLRDVIDVFLPRGWFPAVTPGTKFVTLGGMVAADVHGKNHHKDGAFGAFVEWLDLLGSDGMVRRCSRSENADLFAWTIGGMGLTGIVLRLACRMRPVESAWIRQTTIPAPDLHSVMELFEEHDAATYSVAWIDCLASGAGLGRSAIMLGEHAAHDELPAAKRAAPFATPRKSLRNVPFDLPSAALNRPAVKAFNAAYYRRSVAQRGERLVDWDSYFYPLDALTNWNRIYGRAGFMQFQCAIPLAAAREGLSQLLKAITASGSGSFLAVLKRLGPESGRFSFPMEGYTLALDFPVSPRTLDLMARLDRIVIGHGGRFYLAKDSRMSAETLRASDERVASFTAMRQASAASSFQSSQSERLHL